MDLLLRHRMISWRWWWWWWLGRSSSFDIRWCLLRKRHLSGPSHGCFHTPQKPRRDSPGKCCSSLSRPCLRVSFRWHWGRQRFLDAPRQDRVHKVESASFRGRVGIPVDAKCACQAKAFRSENRKDYTLGGPRFLEQRQAGRLTLRTCRKLVSLCNSLREING